MTFPANQNAIIEFAKEFYKANNYRHLAVLTSMSEAVLSRIRAGKVGIPKRWLLQLSTDANVPLEELKALDMPKIDAVN